MKGPNPRPSAWKGHGIGGLETTGDDNRRPDQGIGRVRRLGASPVGAAEAKKEAKTLASYLRIEERELEAGGLN